MTMSIERSIALVRAASLAPSSHNTQPWRFTVGTGTIELYADRARRLPVNDPDDRELIISCGAALFNLRVAAAQQHLSLRVRECPDRRRPDLLAAVELDVGEGDADLAALAEELESRRTHRDALVDDGIAGTVLPRLVDAVTAEGAQLIVLDGDRRRRAQELVAAGDRVQFADRAWRRELAGWIRPPRRGDGLPQPAGRRVLTRLVITAFDLGARTAATDVRLAAQAPVLAVVTTIDDDAPGWLHAGQAMERLLLTARQAGWQAGFLNQPCQVGGLRPRLRAVLDTVEHPQLLVRLGRPTRAHDMTSRRPLDDVVTIHPTTQAEVVPSDGSPASCWSPS